MPVLPPISDFVTTGQTKATFKGALTGLRAYLSGLLGDTGTQAAALTALGAPLNGTVSKAATYKVVAADRGKLIDCSTGTWTLTIDAVATLGAGFEFGVFNRGTGIITIDPNLSEQINGASTFVLGPGESCMVVTNADASGWLAVLTGGGGDGQFQSMKIITASGTYTKPVGLKRVKVTCVAAGGGGSNSVSLNYVANGGAGGGTVIKVIEAAALAAVETVTIGLGGAGATGASSVAGSAGGTTSFGAHCSATGGAGGAATMGGSQGSWWVDIPLAAGGIGVGGDLNIPGGNGMPPPMQAGGDPYVAYGRRSGAGGDSTHGVGGISGVNPSHGQTGRGYGAGGAGGISSSSADMNGGAGADGVCIVEEFF